MTTFDRLWGRLWGGLKLFVGLLMPLALIPIAAGWVGDLGTSIINGEALSFAQWAMLVCGMVLILVFALWIAFTGRKLLPTKILDQTDQPPRRRVVIALLSPCTNLRWDEDSGAWQVRKEFDPNAPWVSLAGKTIEDLVRYDPAGIPQWKWQQVLRAAYWHLRDDGPLERLVLIGSTGEGGSASASQLDLAERFLGTWLPGKIQVFGKPVAGRAEADSRWHADFEDLLSLRAALQRTLGALHKDPSGYTDGDIVIDCTGGFKVASIAAALVTLDRAKLMFQYVGTGTHSGRIIGFELANEYASL